MKKNHSFSVVDGIAVTHFFKKPKLAGIISAMDEVLESGEYRLRLWVLEEGIDLSHHDIKELALHGSDMWPAFSKAAIVVPDDLSYGLARVHDVYRDDDSTQVFRSEMEAIAWLKEERT